ncbi:glycosyltransferase family 2 protein [Geovibrio thiophilus]|uniref:glycosyltransferase family 2 protein n=1 Tax=Geovibrio thiophilus TaxID=139438 RepID=UPI0013E31480|nr:glycosyltransferase [Geovibrio thiophilus]
MINLSIIIPHYNSVDSLIKLLNSIPDQEDVQVIVIDDKSDKFTEDYTYLRDSKAYEHVAFLDNASCVKGAGVCRNIGLMNAQGNWLLFADADDFFIGGFYDYVAKFFDTHNDIVFFPPTSRDNLTGETSDRHLRYKKLVQNYIENPDDEALLDLRYKFYVPWSKLFRRSFVKDNGIFFDETIASNDLMFSTKTGHYMKLFSVSDEIIYSVTKDVGTLTKNTSEKVFDARVAVHIDYCKFLHDNAPEWYIKKQSLRSGGLILKAINYEFGVIKAISTYKLFSKHQIPVFRMRDLNLRTLKKLIHYKSEHNKQKKYLT